MRAPSPGHHSTERDPLLPQSNAHGSNPPPRSSTSASVERREHTDEVEPGPRTRKVDIDKKIASRIVLLFILLLGTFLAGHVGGINSLHSEQQTLARHKQELDDFENHLKQVNATLTEDRELWNERRSTEQTRLDKLSAKLNDWEKSLNQESEKIRSERKHWNEERSQKEEEERQDTINREKAALHWIDLQPEELCMSYGKRKYRAKLSHLPTDAPGTSWCWSVPVTIHGVEYSTPDWCGKVNGEVYGEWIATRNEPSCQTYFEIQDQEEQCVHGVVNRRRFVGKLGNFHKKDWPNWSEMCETTPFGIGKWNFERPHRCELWPGAMGAVGIVEVYDETCGWGLSAS
ncbi:hypothetical protein DL96DRAFT_1626251 [Flagelloscypha sp. PMI_526]|nr:hypothetical protein DL96DRAFT_1626251 [Flagelloscypha sp. PMI_526]